MDAGSNEQKTDLLKSIWKRVCVQGTVADESELRLFLETMGAVSGGAAGDSAFRGITADMDGNGDGQIDFDEFVEWFLKQKRGEQCSAEHSDSQTLPDSASFHLTIATQCNAGPDPELRALMEQLGFMHYAQVRRPQAFDGDRTKFLAALLLPRVVASISFSWAMRTSV